MGSEFWKKCFATLYLNKVISLFCFLACGAVSTYQKLLIHSHNFNPLVILPVFHLQMSYCVKGHSYSVLYGQQWFHCVWGIWFGATETLLLGLYKARVSIICSDGRFYNQILIIEMSKVGTFKDIFPVSVSKRYNHLI